MLDSLIQKYRTKGILIDSNLLVGLFAGFFNPAYLPDCRATKNFSRKDFELLRAITLQFNLLVTTPHILTEVSNLAGRLPEELHNSFRTTFRNLIGRSVLERNTAASAIVNHHDFLRFGLTDTAISMIPLGSHLVLTDELALYGLLNKRGVDVINFNHIRTFA